LTEADEGRAHPVRSSESVGLEQAPPAGDKPVRFPVAFRVGVSGARVLESTAEPRLREAASAVLRTVAEHAGALADEPWAQKVHAAWNGKTDLRLRLLSPLAEGADRLVAEEAGKLAPAIAYHLSVALPFVQREYERDFPDSVAEFRALLESAQGRVLTLDGGRGLHTEWRSYEAVGHWVARNCDLLIAIWDDCREGGRGGTEDIVRFAVRIGLPVWWIQASGTEPGVLIEDRDQYRNRSDARLAATSSDRLRLYIRKRLQVPKISQAAHQGIHQRLVAAGRWAGRKLHLLGGGEANPLHAFLTETPPPPRAAWRAHGIFMAALRLGLARKGEAEGRLEDAYWAPIYRPPDALASAYADRYRSTYTYVFALAALALTLAALSLAMEAWGVDGPIWPIAAGEFACLAAILALATRNYVGRWHERWIGYRVLAELTRKQQALAALGWTLPSREITQAAATGSEPASWISWYFDAAIRAAPPANGSLTSPQLKTVQNRIYHSLVAGQIAYHTDRAAASKRAALVLLVLGEICFFLTLLAIATKLGLFIWAGPPRAHAAVVGLGLVAAVLPAGSAAAFAMRSYAEFEVLADQSERMTELLTALENRLHSQTDVVWKLASQDLAADLFHLTSAMLADVTGWAQLFRMKSVETG
jgi:hypothetical protein